MDFVHPISAVIPGAQGRVLAVLAETTAELNLRTIAGLSAVSVAQASRVLPGLVELGMVDRREVPPSSLFRLNRANVASQAVLQLGAARRSVLDDAGELAAKLPVPPVSVIVFGSFARGEAVARSDIDAVFVRPDSVLDSDDLWAASVAQWRDAVRALAGNQIEVLEVDATEVRKKLAGRGQVWRDIRSDGVVIHGESIAKLADRDA